MQHAPLSIGHAQITMVSMKTLGSLIGGARERAGYRTKKALADVWGKDSSFISRLENDKIIETLSPEDMRWLRDNLGLSVTQMLLASGYEMEDMSMDEDSEVSELAEHAKLVDWEVDPSRLQVIHAILETWSRFDRNSLRQVAESSPEYE